MPRPRRSALAGFFLCVLAFCNRILLFHRAPQGKRGVDIIRSIGPMPGAQELGPDDVPGHLLQRQAVPLIHRQKKSREHDPQHEEQAAGVADHGPGQQIGRDAYGSPAAETDELALGEIERHLRFDFGKVVWYVYIGNSNHRP